MVSGLFLQKVVVQAKKNNIINISAAGLSNLGGK